MQKRGLSINDRYALAFAQGYNRQADLAPVFRSSSSLENPSVDLWKALTGYTPGSGRPAVNDESALSIVAVYACSRVLSSALASLPVGLFRSETVDGKRQTMPADNRPEHDLIARTPSELYTSFTFRSTLQFHLCLRGNAYALILRNGRGGATELRILHPDDVRPFFDQNTGKLYYEVLPNAALGYPGERRILYPSEILHIKNMSADGIVGRSPIQVHRDTIAIGLSNRNYLLKIHDEGGRVRGALKHPGKLGSEGVTSLRSNFKEAINTGQFPVLENGVEFQAISLTPADAEFIRTHNLTALDICAIYGVPPHKIAILDRATFSNIEHQAIEYTQETLLPTVKNWEPELDRKLLPFNIRADHYYRFNLEGRMRGDTLSRYRAYAIARQWGWKSADDIRELEHENPLPDGQGEMYLSPMNMVPAGEYNDMGDPDSDQQNEPDNGNKTSSPA